MSVISHRLGPWGREWVLSEGFEDEVVITTWPGASTEISVTNDPDTARMRLTPDEVADLQKWLGGGHE